MDYAALTGAVGRECGATVEALEEVPAMDTIVATCEDWTVSELAVHLGAFCGFWTHVLCEGTGRTKTPFPDPPEGPEVVRWLDELGGHLVAELDATPPSTEVWTWFAADHTAGFVARRCAHELAVHRYDAQSALGACAPIDSRLAVDGIDEILESLVTARDRTGEGIGRTLSLSCTDEDVSWRVAMGPDRIDVAREQSAAGAPAGDLAVTGPASDLELVLYHRPALSPVDMSGDYSVLDEWHREFRF